MHRIGVGRAAFVLRRGTQKGYIVPRQDLCVYVFQSDIHRPDHYRKLFKPGEKVEQVVGSESELDRLDILRAEI